jgi:hypothetical protein
MSKMKPAPIFMGPLPAILTDEEGLAIYDAMKLAYRRGVADANDAMSSAMAEIKFRPATRKRVVRDPATGRITSLIEEPILLRGEGA